MSKNNNLAKLEKELKFWKSIAVFSTLGFLTLFWILLVILGE